jgi:hypothetical protein
MDNRHLITAAITAASAEDGCLAGTVLADYRVTSSLPPHRVQGMHFRLIAKNYYRTHSENSPLIHSTSL